MTMRYYKFSAAERKLVLAEAELPEPGPGQVRVRVAAASLNYRDVYMLSRFGVVGIDNRIPMSRRYSFRIGSQAGFGQATHAPPLAAKPLTACCPNT
jgi:NADPH:quinone reductase-like Zn-dependent oxidoreductase